jgi:hypothetical protein
VTPGNAVLGLLANTVAAKHDPERALAVNEHVARAALTIEGSRGEAPEAAARILEAVDRVVLSETMR